ncbi:MAG: hypothetical protein Q9175_005375 [Cornicularia normoerica]
MTEHPLIKIDENSVPTKIPKLQRKFQMGEHVWVEDERKADGSPERPRYYIKAIRIGKDQSISYKLNDVSGDGRKEHGWVEEHLLKSWSGE